MGRALHRRTSYAAHRVVCTYACVCVFVWAFAVKPFAGAAHFSRCWRLTSPSVVCAVAAHAAGRTPGHPRYVFDAWVGYGVIGTCARVCAPRHCCASRQISCLQGGGGYRHAETPNQPTRNRPGGKFNTPDTADTSYSSYLLTPVPTVQQAKRTAGMLRGRGSTSAAARRHSPEPRPSGKPSGSGERGEPVRSADRSPSRYSSVSRGTRSSGGRYGGIGNQSLNAQRARVQQLTKQVCVAVWLCMCVCPARACGLTTLRA